MMVWYEWLSGLYEHHLEHIAYSSVRAWRTSRLRCSSRPSGGGCEHYGLSSVVPLAHLHISKQDSDSNTHTHRVNNYVVSNALVDNSNSICSNGSERRSANIFCTDLFSNFYTQTQTNNIFSTFLLISCKLVLNAFTFQFTQPLHFF